MSLDYINLISINIFFTIKDHNLNCKGTAENKKITKIKKSSSILENFAVVSIFPTFSQFYQV